MSRPVVITPPPNLRDISAAIRNPAYQRSVMARRAEQRGNAMRWA